MPGFIHQVAPEPTLQTTASASAQSTDHRSATPQQNTETAVTFVWPQPETSFWTQPGTSEFIDWITNPENFNRLYAHRTVGAESVADIQANIAEYVNSKALTAWATEPVQQKLAYVRRRYRHAFALARRTSETEYDHHARKVSCCPYFDRLHAVFDPELPDNSCSPSPPAPPRQLRQRQGRRMIQEFSSEASDFEDDPLHELEDNHQESGKGKSSAFRSQASKDNDQLFANKRQVQDNQQSLDSVGAMLDDLKRQTTAMATANESLRASWERQHEEALQQYAKEREKMLRTQEREEMLQQRAQELEDVHERRRKLLEIEKEDFKAERERIMMRLEADRQELKDGQAELKREQLDFSAERLRLATENARMAALLEVQIGHKRSRHHE
ncbi:hypothetical protein EC968_007397 [Mortierella alpina]|nr:hypothetical protein EC968_007397 [Mortierella alpina]